MLYFGWETSWKVSTWKTSNVGKMNFGETDYVYMGVDSSSSDCMLWKALVLILNLQCLKLEN
jgi:hypothetical protein